MKTPRIGRADRIDFRLRPNLWDFAAAHGADIDANWQKRVAVNPHLYNGNVLLMTDVALRRLQGEQILSGTCFTVEYKAFLAWKDLQNPGHAKNVFAMAAVRSADGAYLLGEMAPWTANAGQIYLPCGTPDLNDIAGDTLDLEASALRELAEETGLMRQDFAHKAGWTTVFDGAFIACVKELQSQHSAADLITRANVFFMKEKKPELARLVPVFCEADISAKMPAFMQAYLRYAFATAQG